MGLFGQNLPDMKMDQGGEQFETSSMTLSGLDDVGRKRRREQGEIVVVSTTSDSCATPNLISRKNCDVPSFRDEEDETVKRPVKRFRGLSGIPLKPPLLDSKEEDKKKTKKSPFGGLPEDMMAHCLSFLSSAEDRYALQSTSKQFKRISDSDEMMIGIQVGGDCITGLHGIIQDNDTPDSAAEKLLPFAMSGNLEAIYM